MTYKIELHSAFVLMRHLICLQAVLVELPVETASIAEAVFLCNSYVIIKNWNLPIAQGHAGPSFA